ncbi:Ni/Fe-hydrogenase, b-type cytochrome subunit [Bacillus tuaregi]|uniref:Ni/Fe-hydrogenase, b-type cytochrome subunit n=1 Tax=Bacillus tuaregi TaxID=1816695 RepID=UPI0008F85F4F|nr:Ni/Fe-hydrogenase, b-type cytochrome subunit [Bacillus tuaregi]
MSMPTPLQRNKKVVMKRSREPKVTAVKHDVVKVYVWELPVRIFHWLNAIAIFLLMVTGLFIGNPIIGASVHEEAYYSFVMGWVRYIHFFAAFLFSVNLLFRLYWTLKGNKFSTSNPFKASFWKETLETVKYYLFLKNKKPHYVGHNPLAQLSYWIFIGLGSIIMILTGFSMYVEPQPESFIGKIFAWVPSIFGGSSYDVRSWHHIAAWGFMVFVVVHIYMAFREDYMQRNGTMSSIFTGYKTESKKVLNDGASDEE